MFERNRGPVFKFVTGLAVLAVAVILLAGFFDQGRKLGEQEGRQQANSAKYASHAENEIKARCLPLADAAQAECIRNVVEATNEHDRSERDLVAQSAMAVWAFGMFVVSVAAAFITFLGVRYVKRTLEQTAETNRAALDAAVAAHTANAIMRSEKRPWLTVDIRQPIEFTFLNDDQTRFAYYLRYTIKNMGKTPARYDDIRIRFSRRDWSFVGAGREDATIVNEEALRRIRGRGYRILFPDEEIEGAWYGRAMDLHGVDKSVKHGTLFVAVSNAYWLDPKGEEIGCTTISYALRNEDQRFGPFAFSLSPIAQYGHIE